MRTPIESYVVRIYRNQNGAKRHLVGLVETPPHAGSQGFTSIEQLWEILSGSSVTPRTKTRAKHPVREEA
jgi:hypothetical protein